MPRDDGAIELPNTVALVCRTAKKKIPGLEDFHFHMLRHPYVKRKTKKICKSVWDRNGEFSQHPVLSLGAA